MPLEVSTLADSTGRTADKGMYYKYAFDNSSSIWKDNHDRIAIGLSQRLSALSKTGTRDDARHGETRRERGETEFHESPGMDGNPQAMAASRRGGGKGGSDPVWAALYCLVQHWDRVSATNGSDETLGELVSN